MNRIARTLTGTTDRKARLAAVIAGLGALAAATTDDGLAIGELIAAASAAAVAYGAVYGVANVTEPDWHDVELINDPEPDGPPA